MTSVQRYSAQQSVSLLETAVAISPALAASLADYGGNTCARKALVMPSGGQLLVALVAIRTQLMRGLTDPVRCIALGVRRLLHAGDATAN